jgi:hypothetical protein
MSKAPYSHKYYIITFLLQERAHLCQGFGGQRERERERILSQYFDTTISSSQEEVHSSARASEDEARPP